MLMAKPTLGVLGTRGDPLPPKCHSWLGLLAHSGKLMRQVLRYCCCNSSSSEKCDDYLVLRS
jgi:hypothetical protein